MKMKATPTFVLNSFQWFIYRHALIINLLLIWIFNYRFVIFRGSGVEVHGNNRAFDKKLKFRQDVANSVFNQL